MMRLTLISFLLVWTCGLLAQSPFIETYSRGLELIDEEKFREAADTLERACQLAQPGKTGADWDSAPEQTGTLLMLQS